MLLRLDPPIRTEPHTDRFDIRFAAMGTDIHLVVFGTDARGAARRAVDHLDDLERRWSRFLPGSEISRLNQATGRTTIVSAPTFELIEKAVAGWHLTNGRFNPLMGRSIVSLGYDRSFESIEPSDVDVGPQIDPGQVSEVVLEASQRAVRLPAGAAFDPGAIGKGLAADMVSRRVMADGATGVLVNIGGDLRVRGPGPDNGAWVVSIREPAVQPTALATVRLGECGLATSTTRKRRWTSGGQEQHHVLDPATGRPNTSAADLVTAVAGDAWWAEIMATAALHGQYQSAASSGPLLRVGQDGSVLRLGGFERFEQ